MNMCHITILIKYGIIIDNIDCYFITKITFINLIFDL